MHSSNSLATSSRSRTPTAPRTIPDRRTSSFIQSPAQSLIDKGNAPKLSGAVPEIRLRPGSYLQSFYGKDKEVVTEEFFCNFEINPDFEWAAMEAGFPGVARSPQGEIRAIESPTHRFYLATLFQPQLSSTEKAPHPVVLAFVQAAADWGKKKLDDSVLE